MTALQHLAMFGRRLDLAQRPPGCFVAGGFESQEHIETNDPIAEAVDWTGNVDFHKLFTGTIELRVYRYINLKSLRMKSKPKPNQSAVINVLGMFKNEAAIKKFVIAWITSNNRDEVVKKTGLSNVHQVTQCVSALRRAGVHLPRFKRGNTPSTTTIFDVHKMNTLIDSKSPINST
jgi:hypothetical protein